MTFIRIMVLALAAVAAATTLKKETIESADPLSIESADTLSVPQIPPPSLVAEKQDLRPLTASAIDLDSSGNKGQKYCNRPDKKAKYRVNCPVPAPVPAPTNPVPAPTNPAPTNPAPVCSPTCNDLKLLAAKKLKLSKEAIKSADTLSVPQIPPPSLVAEKQDLRPLTASAIDLDSSGNKGQKYCNRPDKKAKYRVNCPVPAPVPAPTNPVPAPTNPAPAPTDPTKCKPTCKPSPAPVCKPTAAPVCDVPKPGSSNGNAKDDDERRKLNQ